MMARVFQVHVSRPAMGQFYFVRVVSQVHRRRCTKPERVMAEVSRFLPTRCTHGLAAKEVSRRHVVFHLSPRFFYINHGRLGHATGILGQYIILYFASSPVPGYGCHVSFLVRFPYDKGATPRLTTMGRDITQGRSHVFYVKLVYQRVVRFHVITHLILYGFFHHVRFMHGLYSYVVHISRGIRPDRATISKFFSSRVRRHVIIFTTFRRSAVPLPSVCVNMGTHPLSTKIFTRFLRHNLQNSINFTLFPFNGNKRNRCRGRTRRRNRPSRSIFR